MEKVILYRGDSSEIDEFDFHKTSKYCLLGQGIYLTNKKQVGDSYRTKGAPNSRNTPFVLFEGKAQDRPTAIEKAFEQFHHTWWRSLREGQAQLSKEKDEKQARAYYQTLVSDNLVVAEYTRGYVAPPSWSGRVKMDQHRRQERDIKVVCKLTSQVGSLSRFEFEASHFNSSVLKVEEPTSREVRELLLDKGIDLSKAPVVEPSYSYRNTWGSRAAPSLITSLGFRGIANRSTTIRSILEPYGIIGFEYDGGVLVGGLGRHRAFCIWDDGYVNAHRIS